MSNQRSMQNQKFLDQQLTHIPNRATVAPHQAAHAVTATTVITVVAPVRVAMIVAAVPRLPAAAGTNT